MKNKKAISLEYDESVFKPGDMKVLHDNLEHGQTNLYIVATPLQLLSAIEAQGYYQTKNNTLVILIFVSENIQQMFDLAQYFPYSKLMTYQNSNTSIYRYFIKYLNEIKKFQYNYVFFAYPTKQYRAMIANLKYNHLIFLDDGVHTFIVHRELYGNSLDDNNLMFAPEPTDSIRRKIKELVYLANGCYLDVDISHMDIFTMFNIKPYGNEKIITHNFLYIKKLLQTDLYRDDRVFILGQPLEQAIGLPGTVYIQYLKKIFKYYKGRKIIYIPHRSESLSPALQTMLLKYDIEILFINMPIELYFIKNHIDPVDIGTFLSSALFTMNILFDNLNPKAFEINLDQLDELHQKNIKLVYDNYLSEEIEIVRMDKSGDYRRD